VDSAERGLIPSPDPVRTRDMANRTHGTLVKWNADRGFGFIAPADGHAELFVHVSAFPRDGVAPSVGELLSFASQQGSDGRPRAVQVMRAGARAPAQARPRAAQARPRATHRVATRHPANTRSRTIATLLFAGLAGILLYQRFAGPSFERALADRATTSVATPLESSPFSCDGRTQCSQMTSCAEATYFIQHCPNTQMDGNNDGEPCEQQWCDQDF
jgi:cold shock CspA family protein